METLEPHVSTVTSIAFSSDSTKLITGSDDGTARLWDLPTSTILHTFQGHNGPIHSVAFSPDGLNVATAGADGTAKIWDVSDLEAIRLLLILEEHTGPVNAVTFSPTGDEVLTGSDDTTVKLWDAHTTQPALLTLDRHTSHVTSVAFAPPDDSQTSCATFLTGSSDATAILWRLGDCANADDETVLEHPAAVTSVAFSPNGFQALTGSVDGIARIWDISPLGNSVEIAQELEGHDGAVRSVAFSPDGTTVLTGSQDETVKLWETDTGELLTTFEDIEEPVSAVAFAPDGETVFVGDEVGDTTILEVIRPQANTGVITQIGADRVSFLFPIDSFLDSPRRFFTNSDNEDSELEENRLKIYRKIDHNPTTLIASIPLDASLPICPCPNNANSKCLELIDTIPEPYRNRSFLIYYRVTNGESDHIQCDPRDPDQCEFDVLTLKSGGTQPQIDCVITPNVMLSPSPSPEPSFSISPTPSLSPSPSPSVSRSPSPVPSVSISPTPEASATFTATPTSEPTPAVSPTPPCNDCDSDNDRIRDDYETEHGYDPNDSLDFPPLGDINGDKRIDNIDAVTAMLLFLGTFDHADYPEAVVLLDVNLNEKLDNIDAVLVFQLFLGDVPHIPFP